MTSWLILGLVVFCVLAAGGSSYRRLAEMAGRDSEAAKRNQAALRRAQAALDELAKAPPSDADLARRWRRRMRDDDPGEP